MVEQKDIVESNEAVAVEKSLLKTKIDQAAEKIGLAVENTHEKYAELKSKLEALELKCKDQADQLAVKTRNSRFMAFLKSVFAKFKAFASAVKFERPKKLVVAGDLFYLGYLESPEGQTIALSGASELVCDGMYIDRVAKEGVGVDIRTPIYGTVIVTDVDRILPVSEEVARKIERI